MHGRTQRVDQTAVAAAAPAQTHAGVVTVAHHSAHPGRQRAQVTNLVVVVVAFARIGRVLMVVVMRWPAHGDDRALIAGRHATTATAAAAAGWSSRRWKRSDGPRLDLRGSGGL